MSISLSFYSVCLYDEDIETLAPRAWLNDAVICFHIEYLKHRILSGVGDPPLGIALVHPGVVMLASVEDDAEDLAHLLNGLSLGASQLALFPLNDSTNLTRACSGSHWTLLSWRRSASAGARAGFGFYDSAGSGDDRSARVADALARKLAPFLGAGGGGDACDVVRIESAKQGNAYDCGVAVCLTMERLVREHAAAAARVSLTSAGASFADTPAPAAAGMGKSGTGTVGAGSDAGASIDALPSIAAFRALLRSRVDCEIASQRR